MYLMKVMAAVAMGLVVTSCNKNDFDQNAYQQAKEQEAKEKFINNVMAGQQIDPNQTWRTTNTMEVSVTPGHDGVLKIYTANPIGNNVVSLYTSDAKAGETMKFTITKPADLANLYAAVVNDDNQILDLLSFDATGTEANVKLMTTTTRSISHRAAPEKPAEPDTINKTALREPTNMPTAENADYKILQSVDSWGFEIDKTYYIAPGVTVTFNGEWAGLNQRTKIYMGAGSKLVKNSGTLTLDSESILFNDGGTIEANNFTVEKGVLWNKGEIKLTGTLYASNNDAQIYNVNKIKVDKLVLSNNSQLLWNEGYIEIDDEFNSTNSAASAVNYGTFKAGSFKISAGARFFNRTDAEVIVEGETTVGNSNTVWVNNGTFTTGVFSVDQGGNQAFNNCRLTCTDKFSMGKNDGSFFVLQGDASVVTKDFDWNGDSYFWLGGGSLVLVNGTLKSNNRNDDGKGFHQYGDDLAVISAKAITTDDVDNQGRICLYGNICVDADEIFELKYVPSISKNNYVAEGNVIFTTEQYTAQVPASWATETTCRPAYRPNKPKPDAVMHYYYAFEDLGAIGDFDFNDVVLRVSAPVSGVSSVDLMAAGGTLPVKVLYGDRTLSEEVHATFDVDVKTMVNTNYETKDFASLGTVAIAADANMANLPFAIVVTDRETGASTKVTASVENAGETPLMIVVSGYSEGDDAGKWFWAKERTNISTAYSAFGAWGANASSNKDWYHSYKNGAVYKY